MSLIRSPIVQRTKIFDYSKSYATIDVPIFFRKDIPGITNVDSLMGFTVAAKKGDNSINVLKEKGIINIEEYDTAEAVVQAAKDHKLVIFVLGTPPAQYYLYKMGIQDEFHYTSSLLYTSQFYRAVKKGNTGLLTTINNGFAKISESENQAIDQKWFGSQSIPLHEHPLHRVIIIIGVAVFLVALLLFIWNRTLQRMVKQKTSELWNALRARKQVEAEIRTLNAVLEQQNALWRESQRVARMGSYATNLETREWQCSPELHDIFGIDATYPHTLEGWAGIVHPDWQAQLSDYLLQVESTRNASIMAEMAEYVLAHHERWDGLGYPKGLKGEELPLQPRIIAIADAYDAMTSARSYRGALSDEVAIAELQKNAGTQFDPELVKLFIDKVITKPSCC